MKRFSTTWWVGSVAGLMAAWAGEVRSAPPAFSDQTNAAGVFTVHATSGFTNEQYAGGGSVGDFNNDGWQDFFMCSGGLGGVPDKLFINNGDGTFTNEAALWGLTAIHKGKGTCVGDYNNDGWLDIYVTSAGPVPGGAVGGHHKLYRNNGDGTFTDVAARAGVNFTTGGGDGWGAAFGDYDLDGDLDLFVAGFAGGNVGSRLFRNNGDGTFTDVTASIGLFTAVPQTYAFSPRFVDMDGDLWPDLPLVADFGTSRYFHNNGNGTFKEMWVAAGVGKEENGMGGVVGDFNDDGLIDYYVTSIYLPAINWTGNKLYINISTPGTPRFTEIAQSAGVFDGGYGWGTVAVDFNHDMWLDIAETNGDAASSGTFFNEQSYLWMRNPGATITYTEQAVSSGFAHFGKGRGLVHFDYDNDGDQDMILFANKERNFLFRNDLDHSLPNTNWIRVFVNTSGNPAYAPNGYGTRVFATAGGKTQSRSIDGGNTYLGMSELSAHFGLGGAEVVDELRVQWPDGSTTSLLNVEANQTLTVFAGVAEPPVIIGSSPADGAIDPAQPSAPDGSNPAGWDSIELFFDRRVSLLPGDFTVTQDGGVASPPGVLSVTPTSATSVLVQFDAIIEAGAWTIVTYNETGQSVRIGYLPGDINADKTAAVSDVLALINALNGVSPLPLYQIDIDRSGVAGAPDVLREIDLLNGGGAYDVWNLKSLP